VRITEIRSAGLRHGTPAGGWANEIRPEDCVHTLIAVFTDEGITSFYQGSRELTVASKPGSLKLHSVEYNP
jgi:hypothetical protein